MASVGSAEFEAKASFADIVRAAKKVVAALNKVEEAREDASGQVHVSLNERDVRKIPGEIEDAVEDADPDPVPVEADTTPFERGLKAGVAKAVAKAEAEVDVNADTSQLSGEVRQAVAKAEASAGEIDVPVEVDDTGVRRQVSNIARLAGLGQKIKIDVEADKESITDIRKGMGGLLNIGKALSGVMGILKFPVMITGIQLIAGALSAAAAAAVGLVSALGPAVGLLGALPGLAAGIGGSFAAVKLAFSGVGEALSAYSASQKQAGKASAGAAKDDQAAAKARTAAARQVRDALRGVGEAQKQAAEMQVAAIRRVSAAETAMVSALKRSKKAQEALTQARKDALRQLQDLRKEVERGALTEDRAVLNVDQARVRVQEVEADPESTELDRRDAALSLAEAEADLRDVQQQRKDDQAALNEAERKGVEGSDAVVSAKEEIADADQGVLDAQLELREAQAGITEAQVEGALIVARAQEQLQDALIASRDAAVDMATGGAAAIDPFEEALADLPPAAADFVRTLVGLEPVLDRLKNAAAAGLFPGLKTALLNVVSLAPMAESLIGRLAKQVGDTAAEVSTLAFDPKFRSDVEEIGNSGADAMKSLLSAVRPLVSAIAAVGAAAGPLVRWLGEFVGGIAKVIAAQLQAGAASGAMSRFFEETKFVVGTLITALMDVIQGFIDVGRIAYEVIGRDLVGRIGAAAEKFKEFTNSADGENKIRKFFEDAKPVIDEVIGLVGDLFKIFAGLGTNKDLAGLIRQIREEFLPVLEKIISTADTAFASDIISLITSFVDLFVMLSGTSGPLTVFVGILTDLVKGITWLVDTVPGLDQVIFALALFAGALKAFQFGAWITGAGSVIKVLSKTDEAGNAVGILAKSFDKLKTAGVAAIQGIGKAFLANPWLIAILLIIAGIVLLIMHWDTVKKAVGDAIGWVWDKLKAFGAWFMETFEPVFKWFGEQWDKLSKPVIEAWDTIKTKTTEIWDSITAFFKRWWPVLLGIILGPLGVLIAVVIKNWDKLKTFFSTAFGYLMGFFTEVAQFITAVWNRLWEVVSMAVSAAATWIMGVIGPVWEWIMSVWQTGVDFITNLWNTMWSAITTAVSTAAGWIMSVISPLWNWIMMIWHAGTEFLRNVWNTAWAAIRTAASTVMESIRSAIEGPLNWIRDRWNSIWNGLSDTLGGVWNRIKTTAQDGVNGVIGILNTLIRGANTVLDKLGIEYSIPEITFRAAFAQGGSVPGVGNKDTVPALLTPGEFVIKKKSVQKLGVDYLEEMNRTGTLPKRKYARGGYVQRFRRGGSVSEGAYRRQRHYEQYLRMRQLEAVERKRAEARQANKGPIEKALGFFGGMTAEATMRALWWPARKAAEWSLEHMPGRGTAVVEMGAGTAYKIITSAEKFLTEKAQQAGEQFGEGAGGLLDRAGRSVGIFHDGGLVGGGGGSRELLALLERGEGVMSADAVGRVQTMLSPTGVSQPAVPSKTEVSIVVNNPVAATAESSLHREMQKLAVHGLIGELNE